MRRGSLSLVLLGTVMIMGQAARGDDFRIETKVFTGKDKTPASQNTTLFHAGYVYDYLSGPERVAVFDQPHGRFILLDPSRKQKTEVKTDDVMAFAGKFHDWAAKSSNAFMRFAADPDFDVKFSENGEMALTSSHVNYRLQTEPAGSPVAADQFREFSDWYARFNAMSEVGSRPPFIRLAVNAELARRGLVPREVQLTIPAQATLGVSAVSLRSEHHISWRLLERDMERISETAHQLATFKTVDFNTLQPTAVTQR